LGFAFFIDHNTRNTLPSTFEVSTERPPVPNSIQRIRLGSGTPVPALGMGTWRMGERKRDRAREIDALKLGIERGMTLIDTAEMYADGGAERVVGEAIVGRRDEVFLVTKVYPHHATERGMVAACARSLDRLGTDRLDLYLLHWRGDVPLAQTVAGFETLRQAGSIRAWGVSNFDRSDMEELLRIPGAERCVANQVLYHLDCRGIEWDLLPFCRRRDIAVMAYSPFDEGRLLRKRRLKELAASLEISAAQLALAWLLAQDRVIAIPKAGDPKHVYDNLGALDVRLTQSLRAKIDDAFPPPSGPTALAMI
jgi:diketogulonate reductase-like aldo/keto reductase